jgi:hypothetical protein
MPLVKLGAVAVDKLTLLLGRGVAIFGTSVGGSLFRGAVDTFGAEGAFASFESEDYAVTLRTSNGKAGGQLIIGQALVVGGSIWSFKKLQTARKIQAILPLMDYLQREIGRVLGDNIAEGYSLLEESRRLEAARGTLTIEDFAKGGRFYGDTAPSTVKLLEVASRELATATDPDDINDLRLAIEQLSLEIQRTSRKIGTVSDTIQFLNTIEYNPALQKSILESGIPQDIIDLVPDVVNLINDPDPRIPKSVIQGMEQMFGSTIVKGGNEVANAAKQVATGAFNAVNAVTRVQPSDFVGGELTNVDELLREVPQLTPTEIAVVAEQTADVAKGSEQFNDGLKAVKFGISKGKWLARANLLGLADLAWWAGSAVIDLVLNWAGIPEEDQRIEFGDSWFANTIIEPLFDVSGGVGTSPFDVFVFNPVIDWLFPEDPYAALIDLINGDYDTIDALALALLTFWTEEFDVTIKGELPLVFGDLEPQFFEASLPLPQGIEPLDILALATVACVAKIVFKGWVAPAWGMLTQSANRF